MRSLSNTAAMLLCGVLGSINAATLHADESAIQSARTAKWPQEVVINVGDIRTRIDGPKMWTLSGIEYQGAVMATADSAYGTVLTIRNVGHLGTAHFLDVPGKPGHVEKEDVLRVEMFVDDRPVRDFTPKMSLNGDSFRFERQSKIRALDLTTTITIRAGVLTETAQFHVNAPLDLQTAYPWMYALTKDATHFAAGDHDSIRKRITFQKIGQTTSQVLKGVNWIAVFNAATQKGVVCCFLKHPKDTDGWFLLVDAPASYRKVAAYTLEDKLVPKGFTGTYQSAVGFFNSPESEWEARAAQRAAELRTSKIEK